MSTDFINWETEITEKYSEGQVSDVLRDINFYNLEHCFNSGKKSIFEDVIKERILFNHGHSYTTRIRDVTMYNKRSDERKLKNK